MMDFLSYMPMFFISMIPIVGILTTHQRKMAEMIMERESRRYDSEGLRNEVMHLNQVIRQQQAAIDELSRNSLMASYNGDEAPRISA